jgi:hypothetical protein
MEVDQMTVRMLLVFIPILVGSSFPTFASSAAAARADSSRLEAQQTRKIAGEKKKKRNWINYRPGARESAHADGSRSRIPWQT